MSTPPESTRTCSTRGLPQQRHLCPHPHPGWRASCSLHGTLTRTAKLTSDHQQAWTHSCSGPAACWLLYPTYSSSFPPQKPLPRPPLLWSLHSEPSVGSGPSFGPGLNTLHPEGRDFVSSASPPIATGSISLYTDCWEPSHPPCPFTEVKLRPEWGVWPGLEPGTSAPAQRSLRRALFHASPPQSPNPGLTGARGGGSLHELLLTPLSPSLLGPLPTQF